MHPLINVKSIRPYSLALLIIFILPMGIVLSESQAQNGIGTDTKITFTEEKREQARQQLRRIFAEYDLDPWIITKEVKIEEEVDPHSKPILTLNTNFLDSDKMQLAIFIHEQAHWLPYEKQVAAGEDLAKLFQDINGLPNMDEVSGEKRERLIEIQQRIYRHIVVGCKFDGVVELVGESTARKIIKEKK